MNQKNVNSQSSPPRTFSEDEISRRKAWLELTTADEEVLRQDIDGLLRNRSDELIHFMYQHFLAFADTQSFFPDAQTLERAQDAQKHYFERLTKGDYGVEYVQDRLRVGSTHQKIELDPKWYIGAYNRMFRWVLPILVKAYGTDLEKLSRTLSSLLKIIFFDMELAIESYIAAKEAAITKHRDAIRELETEQRVTKSILESAPVGIVSLSQTFVCRHCNDEFLEIMNAPGEQIIGQSLFDLMPGLNRALFEEVLATAQPSKKTAERINFGSTAVHTDTYWDWATWPVKDDSGEISGLVAMFANATDRVLLQQQREDFVATLTHDLKTPVSATNRAVRFLLEGDFGAISGDQKEVLETILQSNTSLYALVQTLLDVYRFDSGVKELFMRTCNLAATITQMVTEMMPLAEEKGVELKAVLPAESVDVLCDEAEIRRVIQNLIDNSLKFTPSGGSITVTMHQSNEKTTISITDTGKGIPVENMPKLFQRFWQAGSTGRYYASTGLGLYLCRRIIEAHQGRIWCSSAPGTGSTFSFEL